MDPRHVARRPGRTTLPAKNPRSLQTIPQKNVSHRLRKKRKATRQRAAKQISPRIPARNHPLVGRLRPLQLGRQSRTNLHLRSPGRLPHLRRRKSQRRPHHATRRQRRHLRKISRHAAGKTRRSNAHKRHHSGRRATKKLRPRNLLPRRPSPHRLGQSSNHGHAQANRLANHLRHQPQSARRHASHPLRPLPGNQHDLRQAHLQSRLRYLVPRQQLHRFHRCRLDHPQSARLQTKKQYPHVLHAARRGRSLQATNRRRLQRNSSARPKRFQKASPRIQRRPHRTPHVPSRPSHVHGRPRQLHKNNPSSPPPARKSLLRQRRQRRPRVVSHERSKQRPKSSRLGKQKVGEGALALPHFGPVFAFDVRSDFHCGTKLNAENSLLQIPIRLRLLPKLLSQIRPKFLNHQGQPVITNLRPPNFTGIVQSFV